MTAPKRKGEAVQWGEDDEDEDEDEDDDDFEDGTRMKMLPVQVRRDRVSHSISARFT